MMRCPSCGQSIPQAVPAALLWKVQASLRARAALLGIEARALDDDMGQPCVALSRGAWTEVLRLHQAEQLLSALEAVSGRQTMPVGGDGVGDHRDRRHQPR